MKLVAIDLSLTATGWACNDGTSGVLTPPKGKESGWPRVQWILDQIHQMTTGADLTVIEGYAFARPNQAHQLGELGGIVRFTLWEDHRPYVDVPPSNLKQFATGKGNAAKAEVLAAAIRRLAYQGHNDNEADALWLLEMATAKYAVPEDLTQSQERALEKIHWPELAAAGV